MAKLGPGWNIDYPVTTSDIQCASPNHVEVELYTT